MSKCRVLLERHLLANTDTASSVYRRQACACARAARRSNECSRWRDDRLPDVADVTRELVKKRFVAAWELGLIWVAGAVIGVAFVTLHSEADTAPAEAAEELDRALQQLDSGLGVTAE